VRHLLRAVSYGIFISLGISIYGMRGRRMEDSVLVCSYEPMHDRTRIGSGSGPGPFLANRRRRRPGQIEMQLNSTWLTRRLKAFAERLADGLPTNKVKHPSQRYKYHEKNLDWIPEEWSFRHTTERCGGLDEWHDVGLTVRRASSSHSQTPSLQPHIFSGCISTFRRRNRLSVCKQH
jgi:hypothetical protein